MATSYDRIEDAIKTALTAVGTKFRRVDTFGSQLSDAEIGEELERLVTEAPAALIVYEGGDSNGGHAGSLDEAAMFSVICVAAGVSREAALRGSTGGTGVYELLDHCREKLHNKTGITGIVMPLIWVGNRRMSLPNTRMTVAAYVCRFKAPLYFSDG